MEGVSDLTSSASRSPFAGLFLDSWQLKLLEIKYKQGQKLALLFSCVVLQPLSGCVVFSVTLLCGLKMKLPCHYWSQSQCEV